MGCLTLDWTVPATRVQALLVRSRSDGKVDSLTVRRALVQSLRCDVACLVDGEGGLVAALFLFRAVDHIEIALAVAPLSPRQAATLLPCALRLFRLTVARAAHCDGKPIRARVRRGHEPGRRLSRLLGLAPAGGDDAIEIWEGHRG